MSNICILDIYHIEISVNKVKLVLVVGEKKKLK